MNGPATEHKLREALDALAQQVHPAPDAYRIARGQWLRRERKRRLVLAILVTVVFTLAVLAGLWVLNHAPASPEVSPAAVFGDGRPPAPTASLRPGT